MRILWLDWRDHPTSHRMQEEAAKIQLELEVCEIGEIAMVTNSNQIGLFKNNRDLVKEFDVLIVRNFHPHISEALTIARLFKESGKTVIDESLTNEGYAISKMYDYLLLAQAGLPVPNTFQIANRQEVEILAETLGYPCLLKGVHGGLGQHVFKIKDVFQLRRTLSHYPDGELVLQEFLPAEEDYRLLTIGFKTVPLFVSRQPRPGDFRTNFALEGEGAPHSLSDMPELVPLAEKASRLLKREFAGVDIRFKKDKPMILEVNRRPGFDGFELATGLNIAQTVLEYIVSKSEKARDEALANYNQ
jgi:RimK family alpha-L-glutamate ligase